MKVYFQIIINPAGGGGKAAKTWKRLRLELERHSISFCEHLTSVKADAIQIAKELALAGHSHLIAVGGDGTAHEVANGILEAKETNPHLEIAMTLFSCGTGNDWVREHKISRNVSKFAEALLNLKYHIQDVGLIDFKDDQGSQSTRYFINVAGMAYDAFVAKNTEGLKNGYFSGKFYLLHVFRNLLRYKPEKVLIKTPSKSWVQTVYTINIGQCRYSGGNMQLVPHASFDSGKLAVTVANQMPKWEIVLQTPKFYNGKLLDHPLISDFQCDSLEILSQNKDEVLIEADGEYIGTTPVAITNLCKKLKVFAVDSI